MLLACINGFACGLSLAIALRLLTFRRHGKAHRYAIALLAWVLINLLIAYAGWLFMVGFRSSIFAAVNAIALTQLFILALKAKGNIKQLVRQAYDHY